MVRAREEILPWASKFALGKLVPLSLFEGLADMPSVSQGSSRMAFPGLTCAPMGWEHSTVLIQRCQRRVSEIAGLDPSREIRPDRAAVRPEIGKPVFGIYIDNYDETHLIHSDISGDGGGPLKGQGASRCSTDLSESFLSRPLEAPTGDLSPSASPDLSGEVPSCTAAAIAGESADVPSLPGISGPAPLREPDAPAEWQARMRQVKQELGIPQNKGKAIVGSSKVITLGYELDGINGLVHADPVRRRTIFRIGVALLARGVPPRTLVRAFLGKWIHACLIRRPLLSILSEIFGFSHKFEKANSTGAAEAKRHRWSWEKAVELLLSICVLPVLDCNLRASFCPFIYATDASDTGGAVVKAPLPPERAATLLKCVDFRGSSVVLSRLPKYLKSENYERKKKRKSGAAHPLSFCPGNAEQNEWGWEDVFHWKWHSREHITLLETRSVLAAIKSLPLGEGGQRIFFLQDNGPCKGALGKGRSPSRRLNGVLRRVAGRLVKGDWTAHFAWVASSLQPADDSSRL